MVQFNFARKYFTYALLGGGSFLFSEEKSSTTKAMERLWDLPVLYKNEENQWLQKLALTGMVQWQYADVEAKQGDGSGSEFRRFRFGGEIRFLNNGGFKS